MSERMSLVVFSGTVDKLMPVAILTSGAVAMGMEVEIFLTFWGLDAVRKGRPETLTRMSRDYEDLAPALAALMREKEVPSWYTTLRAAKEIGPVTIHACAMTMDLQGLTKDDLDDIVDDVVGAAEFVDRAREGRITLFI